LNSLTPALPEAICDDREATLRRREISFSQGTTWNALISTYIGTIPLSADTPCAGEHIMSAPPSDKQLRIAMTGLRMGCENVMVWFSAFGPPESEMRSHGDGGFGTVALV